MAGEIVTEEQWKRIAIVALSDLQALGMDINTFLKHQSNADSKTVLKEVDRYMWERHTYS